MKRDIIHIDEEKCNGCGACIPNCHEGALQLIDGKARLISDLLCDGLGACIGHCPIDAISIEQREAEPYNEIEALKTMVDNGKNTVIAHLKHLADHNEEGYLKEAFSWLQENKKDLSFDVDVVLNELSSSKESSEPVKIAAMAPAEFTPMSGCMGSQTREITKEKPAFRPLSSTKQESELRQWPVQFHLINPAAGYFSGADVLLASDCSAYAMGNFHSDYLKGKSLIIACPKLDTGQESYLSKLVSLIDDARINTIHVLLMEVPCCNGLLRLVDQAISRAKRRVPVKATVVGIGGKVLSEEWV